MYVQAAIQHCTYITYKNKCQHCMRRYPVYAGGNPALQMLVNQVWSSYVITQTLLLSQIIVVHLFPQSTRLALRSDDMEWWHYIDMRKEFDVT